jgi:hypothetical protein
MQRREKFHQSSLMSRTRDKANEPYISDSFVYGKTCRLTIKMHELKIVNENEKDAKVLEKMNRKRKLIAKTKINVAYKRRMAPHPV